MKKKSHEEVPAQSGESKETDRILAEAYAFMRERQRFAKTDAKDDEEARGYKKQELVSKVVELKRCGMTEGELSKLIASLNDPKLTNY